MTRHDALLSAAQGYVKARKEQWQRYERFGRITERTIKKEQEAYEKLEQAVEDATNEL